MSDLVAGRYPIFAERAAYNGVTTYQDIRENFDRRDIATNGTLTSGTMYVLACAFQPGDIIGAVNVSVNLASATPTHGWAAVYSGVAAASTLIQQSADNILGLTSTGAAQKFTLAAVIQVGGAPAGVAQGAPTPPVPAASGAPIILGVAIFNQATTGGKLDGVAGGSVAGNIIATGQVSLVGTVTGITGATAPATLSGITASAGFCPYCACTRS